MLSQTRGEILLTTMTICLTAGQTNLEIVIIMNDNGTVTVGLETTPPRGQITVPLEHFTSVWKDTYEAICQHNTG